jgi:uncharacterized protein (TIGR03437 family)
MRYLFGRLCALLSLAAALASAQVVPPGGGVTFEQITFGFEGMSQSGSAWARAVGDPAALMETTGLPRGFVNIFSEDGWVVQNWPLDASEALLRAAQPMIPPDTNYFQLFPPSQSPHQVTTLPALVQYTPLPIITPPPTPSFSAHPVAFHIWDAEGAADAPVTHIGPPPAPSAVTFEPQGETFSHVLPYPSNIEAADNQCVPASVANSLQYLEDRYGLPIPDEHRLGLKGDNTLVGKLDTEMDRSVTSRRSGSGLWFVPMLNGKFEYLEDSGLEDALVLRHQGRGWGGAGNQLPAGDYSSSGLESTDDGAAVTWDWICDQIKAGEDVELIFSYDNASGQPTGGHAVRVFGCGKTNDRPWLKILHDSAQNTDSFGLETPTVYIQDRDGDGMLNFRNATEEIRFAHSESVTDEVKRGEFSPPQTLGEAIVNAATFLDERLTGGSIATAFGFFRGLLQSSQLSVAGGPGQQPNLEVLVNGIPAPVFFANQDQINFQIPVEIEPGTASVVVLVNGIPSDLVTTPIAESAPGIFLLDESLAGPGRGVIQNQDFSINLPAQPAAPGSALVLYMTGTGPYDPPVPTGELAPGPPFSLVALPVTATIGGQDVDVLFAGGAPGFAGLTQVNLLVPQLAAGDHAVVVTVGGVESNSVLAAIGP